MSGYTGRRGHPVNVSQLLQDLNRIPEPAPQPDDNLPSLDDELAMFTNTTFIDWDTATPHGSGQETSSTTSPTAERVSSDAINGDMSNFDFNLSVQREMCESTLHARYTHTPNDSLASYLPQTFSLQRPGPPRPFFCRGNRTHFLSKWINGAFCSAEDRGIPQKTTSCTTDAFHGFFANYLLTKLGTRLTPPPIAFPRAVIGSLAMTWGPDPGKRLKVHSLDRIACYGAIPPMVQFPVILR
ncbi:hypothetical protein EKO27_g8343 [Xylaria grammica]|uniref:Uncharacterized protein n=1 Tax=Xylaria grammica TaxID=363999 RepID=A0A439CXB0_9PEZI|nr:hypothetical protein EKO27_g8343 [Xylaria grammica]